MAYRCAACGEVLEGDMVVYVDHTEKHIVELLKHDHPDWAEKDGICQKCLDYYRAELTGSVFKDAPCVLRQRKISSVWQKITTVFSGKKKDISPQN